MDITFFALVMILLVIGLVMLFSASTYFAMHREGNPYHFISRQLVFAAVGLVAMFLISRINYQVLRKFAWVLYGAAVALLILVLVIDRKSTRLNSSH